MDFPAHAFAGLWVAAYTVTRLTFVFPDWNEGLGDPVAVKPVIDVALPADVAPAHQGVQIVQSGADINAAGNYDAVIPAIAEQWLRPARPFAVNENGVRSGWGPGSNAWERRTPAMSSDGRCC